MNESLKFSIVIPTYNRASLLREALQSLIDQTYANWEAVVVDNHSEDNTQAVVKSFKDERIKLHFVHNNGVIAKSRNVGIAKAIGDWVCFLDSDDQYYPNKLQRCSTHIDDQVDFIYHAIEFIDKANANRHKVLQAEDVSKPVFKSILFGGAPFATSSVVVRRSIIDASGGFNENPKMIASEDFHCWLSIARLTNNFASLREILGMNLIGHDNASNRDMSVTLLEVFKSFEDDLSDSDQQFVRLIAEAYHLRFLVRCKKYMQFHRASKDVFSEFTLATVLRFVFYFLYPRLKKMLLVYIGALSPCNSYRP
jgi:glycosyltransferase involved in cell wall biosynthesis